MVTEKHRVIAHHIKTKAVHLHHRTVNFIKGFTLIELMVVVALIAILSIIGIALYRVAVNSANDAKRRTDINAIAKAYEANFNGQYQTLTASMFAGSQIPTPPEGGHYFGTIPSELGTAGFRVCAPVGGGPICTSPQAGVC